MVNDVMGYEEDRTILAFELVVLDVALFSGR